jgi:hypothetical protein
MDSSLITYPGCDWQIKTADDASNFVLSRQGGQNFHITLVEGQAKKPDGSVSTFRQPMIIEHDQGTEKVGDVVIVFREHPKTGRWMIQTDKEDVYENETTTKKIWRANRSSVDNVIQAVRKTVAHTGWIYANARRIGGKPIKTHYVIANWAPQLSEEMMDVYDYVQSLDSMGLASFLKALQIMPDRPARAIFNDMRNPSKG